MAGNYTVKQGDYLSKIAKENGFTDYHTIWDHPNNAQLKEARVNPNILFPGDQLVIPDKEERRESGNTEKRHIFVIKKQPLKLRLVLEDIYEKPIAAAPCTLRVDGQTFQATTDGSGKIEQEIPATAKDGFLVLTSDQTPFEDVQIPVKIGSLDPVDQVSGQIARLNNLGYFAGNLDEAQDSSGASGKGETDGGDSSDAYDGSDTGTQGSNNQFLSAVEEFQCDYGLTVDGVCGPMTQAKLNQVHGC